MDAITPPTAQDKKRAYNAAWARTYRANNRDAYLEKHKNESKKWRDNNPEESRDRARKYRARNPNQVRCSNLKKTHGITLNQFNEMFLSQGSKCAICKGGSSTGKNWHVDHCHNGGGIRGILCHSCNLMIGQARDNAETLLAAVEYLRGSK